MPVSEYVEPIEAVALVMSVLATFGSGLMLRDSMRTLRTAHAGGLDPSSVSLARLTVIAEVLRGVLALAILFSAVIQVTTPTPEAPTSMRPYLQLIWVILPTIGLSVSLLVRYSTLQILEMIRQESEP